VVFSFKQVTISGANEGVEGTSAVINAITDVLVNEVGWLIEDDRRNQAGSTLVANTHKIVFNSNGGESGSDPNWYLTLISGSGVATANDNLRVQVSTAYNVSTHLIPASGVGVINSTNVTSLTTTRTDSDGYNLLFVAADKDGIAIFNNFGGTFWGVLMAGKAITPFDASFEPYGVYLHTSTVPNVIGTDWRGIVGNPPSVADAANDGVTLNLNIAASQEPRSGLGNSEAIFTALPIVWSINDVSPAQKGTIGFVRHIFSLPNSSIGIPFIGKMVVPGTAQEFIVFGDSISIALRAS